MADASKSENVAELQDEIVQRWKEEQLKLKKKLITTNSVEWIKSSNKCVNYDQLQLVGGVDISFKKGDENHACACLVVLSFPKLEVIYHDLEMVHLTAPYVPEFLAFREVEFLVRLITRLKEKTPLITPQVILVDGNGMLHPRGFGIACHLGVLTDIPTIGVAKTLFHVDGIEKSPEYMKEIKNSLKKGGDVFPLIGKSGELWGKALMSTDSAPNPIFISVGHRIGLECAVHLVYKCCNNRVPEPTRQADILSRRYIRENYEKEIETCSCQMELKSFNESFRPSIDIKEETVDVGINTAGELNTQLLDSVHHLDSLDIT